MSRESDPGEAALSIKHSGPVKWTSALAVALALAAGCASDGTAEFVQAATSRVAQETRDPAAAQFRNVVRGSPGYVCGEINAKNEYGGYVGFVRFLGDTTGDAVFESPEEPIDSAVWTAVCDTVAAPTAEARKALLQRYDSTVRAAALATLDSMRAGVEAMKQAEAANRQARALEARARQLVEDGIHPFIGWRSRRVMYSYFCKWYAIPSTDRELFETEKEGAQRGYRMASDSECGL